MQRAGSIRAIVALALAAAVVATAVSTPLGDRAASMVEAIRSLGAWGLAAIAVLYVPACVLLLPGSLLTLVAGYLFGLAPATAAVSAGSTTGAACAFLVGRFLARGWVESRLAANPRFRALDRAVGEKGFRIVLLLRLSPAFPFNLLNYALGLTAVPFGRYVLASWIGMLPGTVLYAYLGATVKDVEDLVAGRVEMSAGQHAIFALGLVATILVTVVITRTATQALDAAAHPASDPPGTLPLESPRS